MSETAERTIEHIEAFDDESNEYGAMARDHYGAAVEPYRQAVVKAAQSLVEALSSIPLAAAPPSHGE